MKSNLPRSSYNRTSNWTLHSVKQPTLHSMLNMRLGAPGRICRTGGCASRRFCARWGGCGGENLRAFAVNTGHVAGEGCASGWDKRTVDRAEQQAICINARAHYLPYIAHYRITAK